MDEIVAVIEQCASDLMAAADSLNAAADQMPTTEGAEVVGAEADALGPIVERLISMVATLTGEEPTAGDPAAEVASDVSA